MQHSNMTMGSVMGGTGSSGGERERRRKRKRQQKWEVAGGGGGRGEGEVAWYASARTVKRESTTTAAIACTMSLRVIAQLLQLLQRVTAMRMST